MRLSIVSIVLLFIFIAVICFQLFLSKKESRWLGLVLPFICFLTSLLMTFSIVVYDGMTGWDVFSLVMTTFLQANIPTTILILIYFGSREKIKRKKELEKMNVQDLE